MNKKYSYREIEKVLNRDKTRYTLPTVDEILEMLQDVMKEQGVGIDDVVWDWPEMDQELENAYDRAMSIL